MTYVRPTTMLDILSVYEGVCQDERDEIAALGHSIDPSSVAATLWTRAGVQYTIADGDTHQPLGILGVSRTHANVYRGWMMCRTDALERCGKDIGYLTGHTIAETFKQLEATRFEVVCLTRRLLAQRWYVKLGFVKECDLAGYGAEPFSMYVYTGEKT